MKRWFLFLIALIIMGGCTYNYEYSKDNSQLPENQQVEQTPRQFAEGRIAVGFTDLIKNKDQASNLINSYGLEIIDYLDNLNTATVRVPIGKEEEYAYRLFKNPKIKFAEPDYAQQLNYQGQAVRSIKKEEGESTYLAVPPNLPQAQPIYYSYCGNGIKECPNSNGFCEVCDNGVLNSNIGICNPNCLLTTCGDGYLQQPNGYGLLEQCDYAAPAGTSNNNCGSNSCSNQCQCVVSCTQPYVIPGQVVDLISPTIEGRYIAYSKYSSTGGTFVEVLDLGLDLTPGTPDDSFSTIPATGYDNLYAVTHNNELMWASDPNPNTLTEINYCSLPCTSPITLISGATNIVDLDFNNNWLVYSDRVSNFLVSVILYDRNNGYSNPIYTIGFDNHQLEIDSNDIITFRNQPSGLSFASDIFVYYIPTSTLTQLTNTPSIIEREPHLAYMAPSISSLIFNEDQTNLAPYFINNGNIQSIYLPLPYFPPNSINLADSQYILNQNVLQILYTIITLTSPTELYLYKYNLGTNQVSLFKIPTSQFTYAEAIGVDGNNVVFIGLQSGTTTPQAAVSQCI